MNTLTSEQPDFKKFRAVQKIQGSNSKNLGVFTFLQQA
jgi:hypothetical protein